MTKNHKVVKLMADRRGLGCRISNPGDGTRYRFETKDGGRDLSPTLRSYNEALVWVNGYDEGRHSRGR